VLVGPSGSKSTLRFDEHGLVARQCANGTWELSQYDDEGRLEGRLVWKRASDGAIQGWSIRYEWTAEGDLVRVVDSLRGTTVYRTDAAHRLIGERTPDGQELSYDLDLADNVLSKPKPGRQGVSRVEIGSGNRLVASDTETFTYDHRDQLSSRRDRRTGATTHYVYDSFDMLVRLETRGPDGAELEPAWQYTYDALGRRTEVRRGGYRRQFYWDGDRLAAEVMPNGALRVYEYAGHGALVPLAFTDYASADAPPESGKHYTVFTDPVGQPLQIEDAKGQLVWFASRVDPYGHIEVHPASQLEYNLRWPGHYHDPETALHYNRYRYYDPGLGRYLQTDPLGYEGSPTNLYGYPANPLTDVDVLGLTHPHVDDGSTPPHGPAHGGTEGVTGAALATAHGLPSAPDGYHWANVGGRPTLKSNPGSDNPPRMYNPATGEFPLRPPADAYPRVSFTDAERAQVFNAARDSNGVVTCPCGRPVASHSAADMDMGHRPGHDYASARDQAIVSGTSRSDFRADQKTLSNYRPEHPSCNRSHVHE
jgi:RHS repeat-associated protein